MHNGSMRRRPLVGQLVSGILLSVAIGACGAADPVSRLPLTDGRLVSDLTGRRSETVVLLYSPTQCFTCSGLLAEWRQFGRDQDVDVALVLTGPPTADQEAGLALRRVRIAGTVAEGASTSEEPAAYFFRGRTLADSAVGELQQARLLREMRPSVGQELSPGPPQ